MATYEDLLWYAEYLERLEREAKLRAVAANSEEVLPARQEGDRVP